MPRAQEESCLSPSLSHCCCCCQRRRLCASNAYKWAFCALALSAVLYTRLVSLSLSLSLSLSARKQPLLLSFHFSLFLKSEPASPYQAGLVLAFFAAFSSPLSPLPSKVLSVPTQERGLIITVAAFFCRRSPLIPPQPAPPEERRRLLLVSVFVCYVCSMHTLQISSSYSRLIDSQVLTADTFSLCVCLSASSEINARPRKQATHGSPSSLLGTDEVVKS